MDIIVVTGKSGSGKTLAASILSKKLGANLLCLDEISHLSLEDENIKNFLGQIFGNEIFDDGKVNRKKLGAIAFNDKTKLEKLNNLSWKFIDEYTDNFILNSKEKFVILEYALLPKMKYFKMAKYKILIYADQKERFEKLKLRDGVNEDYLLMREKNSLEYDKSEFDFVIDNTHLSKKQLDDKIEKIAKKIQI